MAALLDRPEKACLLCPFLWEKKEIAVVALWSVARDTVMGAGLSEIFVDVDLGRD